MLNQAAKLRLIFSPSTHFLSCIDSENKTSSADSYEKKIILPGLNSWPLGQKTKWQATRQPRIVLHIYSPKDVQGLWIFFPFSKVLSHFSNRCPFATIVHLANNEATTKQLFTKAKSRWKGGLGVPEVWSFGVIEWGSIRRKTNCEMAVQTPDAKWLVLFTKIIFGLVHYTSGCHPGTATLPRADGASLKVKQNYL